MRDKNQPWENNNDNYLTLATGLRDGGTEVKIRTEREFGIQRRPSQAERTTSKNKKTPDVEDEARLAWAVGSAASQTAIELSPPYAPDDRVVGSNGSYAVIPSDAAQKVLAYARTENRYLFGHRNGNGIQVLPEMLPAKPLSVVFIRLNGCTGAFLVNGRTWNIDPSGVTLTCDALFWGAVDGTTAADAWFPMPPELSALPAPVAISTNANSKPANAINIPGGFNFGDPNLSSLFASLPTGQAPVYGKTVTPGRLVTPYHETTAIAAGSGSGAFVSVQFWVPTAPIAVLAGSGSGAFATLSRPLWISAASTFTPGGVSFEANRKAWLTNSTSFTPGYGQIATPALSGVQWVSDASVFTPGSAGAGMLWVSAQTTFTPGRPTLSIPITSGGLTNYIIGEIWLSGFFSYSELVDGTMLLSYSGNQYFIEFLLPSSLQSDFTTVFNYTAEHLDGSKWFNTATQTYTGSGNVTDNSLEISPPLTNEPSVIELSAQFAVIGGPVTALKHTLTITS